MKIKKLEAYILEYDYLVNHEGFTKKYARKIIVTKLNKAVVFK